MRRLGLVVVAVAAAVVAPGALAKEPTAASIDGPGLNGPITIGWSTSGAGIPIYGNRKAEAKVMALAESSGFFPAVFGRSPDPMLQTQPAGRLGPRYTIVFGLPGPGGGSRISQDVYPYAQPAPVTYMKPGQPFWDGQRTRGGWFVGGAVLEKAFVSVGLPERAPSGGNGWSWPSTALASVGGAILLAAILLLLRKRIRSAPERRAHAV